IRRRPIIPYPTGRFLFRHAFPGTACQATIGMSLRDVACSYFATAFSQEHSLSSLKHRQPEKSLLLRCHSDPVFPVSSPILVFSVVRPVPLLLHLERMPEESPSHRCRIRSDIRLGRCRAHMVV